MAWFDPYYDEYPVEREFVYLIAEIINNRNWKHAHLSKFVWGTEDGRTWRNVRNEKVKQKKDGTYKPPRRITIDDAYKMANFVGRDFKELMDEAKIRYESKLKKNNTPPNPPLASSA